ncbi:MAG: hypothetical protein WC635_12085 [Bacteriovorax sp.]|jgi:hypothetical protein
MRFVIKIAIFLFFCFSLKVFADSVLPPSSSVSFSENKKIACVNWLHEDKDPIGFYQETINLPKDEFSRKNYPESGVYELSNRKLLWVLKVEENDCQPLNDGHYAIVHGPWASDNEDLAYAFYKDGHLLKKYRIKDICNNYLAYGYSTSHFEWVSDFHFSNDTKKIDFTACFRKISIDVTTGEMEKEFNPPLYLLFLVLSIVGYFVFKLSKKYVRRKKLSRSIEIFLFIIQNTLAIMGLFLSLNLIITGLFLTYYFCDLNLYRLGKIFYEIYNQTPR